MTIYKRFPHRLKANHGSEGPSNLVVFDTETWPAVHASRPNILEHKLRLGVAIAWRQELGKVTHRKVCRFRDRDGLFAFLESRLRKKTPLWCFAHNLPFDFRVSGGFKWCEDRHLQEPRYILADPPTIIRGKWKDCNVNFVDTLNYWKQPLAQLGADLGLPKFPMPAFTAGHEDWFLYCERDAEICERAVRDLIDYWREHDLGTFGRTAAQCSMNAYRHRFQDEDIFFHTNEQAHGLERRAYYGGRNECFRIGRIEGPLYLVDINSQYPWCMRWHQFPRKLIDYDSNVPVRVLRSQLKRYGGVAVVWIDSDQEAYPRRGEDRIEWVTGTFLTTLCGPELRRAVDSGHVLKVEHCALYELAWLFPRFVEHFFAERQRYQAEGNQSWEAITKLVLTSLSGKFAQQTPEYAERVHLVPPTPWGKFMFHDAIEGKDWQCRAIAHTWQEEVDEQELPNVFPAISAFITAWGREKLREYMLTAGPEQVVYVDTDSLLVTEEGLDNLLLAGTIHPKKLGQLKLAKMCSWVHLYGCKDYEVDGVAVLKGIKHDAYQRPDGRWDQWEWERAGKSLDRHATATILCGLNTIELRRAYTKGVVHPDGRVTPHQRMDRFQE